MRFRSTSVAGWLVVFLALAAPALAADPGSLTISVNKPGVKISPLLYGLMTEEINHSYDGGLYGELIQNRIFKDDAKNPVHWSLFTGEGSAGKISLDSSDPINKTALTTALRIDITKGGGRGVGVNNDGFWGIPLKPDTKYSVSFYAKASQQFIDNNGQITFGLHGPDATGGAGPANVGARLHPTTTEWKKYTATLTTNPGFPPTTDGHFSIGSFEEGTIWLNLVSVFPPTFNNRPNGLRIDLMEQMRDLHPAFLRFPGGNYLEGNTSAERFNWKETIGPLEDRPGHQCPWGYRSSDGMGLLEFLTWCEDLKIEPVLAVYAGYSLKGERVQGDALKPFIQDALDEIEYVTGDASTQWGAVRLKNGHPAPFKLTYVEIGNEDNFDNVRGSYDGRYAALYDAVKPKYPNLQLIATTRVNGHKMDVLDDHYYRSARDMERDATHYDAARMRTGPKIFVGEWATTEGSPTPTLNAALADAAWLTGLERDSDLVVMSCYAPLFVNVNPNARQWGTNLIGYDALNSFASPSYYAQQMFNKNRGDSVLPVTLVPPPAAPRPPEPMPHGAIGVGTWGTVAEYKDIKVTSNAPAADGAPVKQEVLFTADLSKDGPPPAAWKISQGDWKIVDGALRNQSENTDCHITFGDPKWTDYTVTMKARKISGAEGVMVLFDVANDGNWVWWNVGGWTNTRTALERAENGAKAGLGPNANLGVETNRRYDLRIETQGRSIKCYLDDKLITQATNTPLPPAGGTFATASRVDDTGEVLVKVVNADPTPESLAINLDGVTTVDKTATVTTLTGDPSDVNDLENPRRVAPKEATISNVAAKFTHEFPAHSVTVIRLKAK